MGVVTNYADLSKIYSNAHFVLITSSSEGFPLSLSEGMSHGCIPISTPVGDIPFHIKNGVNGVICQFVDYNKALNELFNLIINFNNSSLLSQLSNNAVNYSIANFSKQKFELEYKKILNL